MELTDHQKRLQRVYASAPIMRFYNTSYLGFTEEGTKLTLQVDPKYFHAERAMHGSVYFRMLDDAAYFACAGIEDDKFIVTKNFNVELLRPVSSGKITAIGSVTGSNKKGYQAKSELYDENEQLIATGTGNFVRMDRPWTEVFGYSS